jgi:hypothetical protein
MMSRHGRQQGIDRMMRFFAVRRVAMFCPLLVVVACASGNRSVSDLHQRMQLLLAPDIAAGRAGLERLPDGARVTLPQQALFPTGRSELDDKGRFVLASVIQGLLDPGILRIDIALAPGTPVGLQTAQARAVTQYFVDYGLGSSLEPAAPQPESPPGSVGEGVPGLTITVNIISS